MAGMDFAAWDEAIATRLQPIRTELAGISVAALPREAGKFGSEEFESIDWLFPTYDGAASETGDRVQDVTVTLAVRLYFKKRYPKGAEKDALEWAESQVLQLLSSYRLPDTLSCLRLATGRLFAPVQGQWFKEISFTFKTRLYPTDGITPPPPVQIIGIDDPSGQLVEVSE